MFLASVSNSIDIIGFHIRYSHQFLQTDLNVLSKNPVLLLTLPDFFGDALAVGLHSDYNGSRFCCHCFRFLDYRTGFATLHPKHLSASNSARVTSYCH